MWYGCLWIEQAGRQKVGVGRVVRSGEERALQVGCQLVVVQARL